MRSTSFMKRGRIKLSWINSTRGGRGGVGGDPGERGDPGEMEEDDWIRGWPPGWGEVFII